MRRSPSGGGVAAVKLLRGNSGFSKFAVSRGPSSKEKVPEEKKLASRGDPEAVFKQLRETLGECKDDLTPYGWRVYFAEFHERVAAEKRLKTLAARAEADDDEIGGLIEGTPLFQEKFDAMLHAEHLKSKILEAHSKFGEAADLMMKCHSLLAMDFLLSDKFCQAITYVPDSKHDQVELVYRQVEQKKKELKELQDDFDTFRADTQRGRDFALRKAAEVSKNKAIRLLQIIIFAEWNWQGQREQVLRLQGEKVELVAHSERLQENLTAKCAELAEKTALWAEEKSQLEAELAKYKRLHEKQLAAAKQAMEEAGRRKQEGQDKDSQILQLINEKTALISTVETLEEELVEKRRTIAKLDDNLAEERLRFARLEERLRETEADLAASRERVEHMLRVEAELREQIARGLEREAQLQLNLEISRNGADESERRCAALRLELAEEQQARLRVEEHLASVRSDLRRSEELLVETKLENARRVKEIEAKWKKDFEEQERRLKADFEAQTIAIRERNVMLEREVALGEGVLPHLSVLRPLGVDMSQVCVSCKKVLVYEGEIPKRPV